MSVDLYGARDALEIVRKCLILFVAIMLLCLVLWLALVWLCLLPFRMAYRLHAPRTRGARLAELEGLAALAVAALALVRSGQAPMSMKEWKRQRRKLMGQRPDDTIPF